MTAMLSGISAETEERKVPQGSALRYHCHPGAIA